MDLNIIVTNLSKVPGIKAIALGGSQSRGEADEHSDYDIGIYYEPGALDTEALENSLEALDDGHRGSLLNKPGEWGPWINGGAWITVNNTPVDILLRDLARVEAVLTDCIEGRITIDYQCGHPFGFINTIYAAETYFCKPLWQDRSNPLDQMKALLFSKGEYSPAMRESVVKQFQWEAWFSLACGRKAAFKGDVNYAAGSVFRAVCSWVQVLYALNGRYLMNEKGALKQVSHFELKPADMEAKVKASYKLFSDGRADEAYPILDALHEEIQGLAGSIEALKTVIR